MSKQTLNLGTAPAGSDGDTVRGAFVKTEANMAEIYNQLGATGTPPALPAALPIAKGGTGGNTQAAALNALGFYGAALRPLFASVGARSIVASEVLVQGVYMGWNSGDGGLTGGGTFICNRGAGSGGFSWRTVNSDNTATGPVMTFTYAGALNVPGAVSQNSDRRLKINDEEILDGLEKVLAMRPVEYDRKDTLQDTEYPHHEVGMIAQELYDVAPLLVTPASDDVEGDIWRVNYAGVIPYLISAVKALKAEVDALKSGDASAE